MRVLFDRGAPVPMRRLLSTHEISTAYELGWSTLKNGELLSMAEAAGFEVMVTTDRNQSTRRILGLVVFRSLCSALQAGRVSRPHPKQLSLSSMVQLLVRILKSKWREPTSP